MTAAGINNAAINNARINHAGINNGGINSARWVLGRFPIIGSGACCRYCGRMQAHDCPPVECLACGSRQCHGNGAGAGTCSVCHHGYLPGWSREDHEQTCGYRRCTAAAVAKAPRVGQVCRPHLTRPTLRWAGHTETLADYIAGRIAHRDAGRDWERWTWVELR